MYASHDCSHRICHERSHASSAESGAVAAPKQASTGQHEGVLHSVLEDIREWRVSSTIVHDPKQGELCNLKGRKPTFVVPPSLFSMLPHLLSPEGVSNEMPNDLRFVRMRISRRTGAGQLGVGLVGLVRRPPTKSVESPRS